jgi:hypothetical protein
VNYKAHGDLSWFRPLLGGNSPTSSNLILKMNMCYKGCAKSSRSLHGEGGKWISSLLPKGYGAFHRSCSGRITTD